MDWQDMLKELAKKLTPILAFGVMVIIVVALLGNNISKAYQTLIYIVVVGSMLIYAAIQIIQIWPHRDNKPLPATPNLSSTTEAVPPAKPPKSIDSGQAREKYLRAILADCRPVRLVGLDPQASDPSRGGMTLESLYISLDTTTQVEREKDGKKGDQDQADFLRQESRPLSALEALSSRSEQRMVLLGLPGTGKSTFVRYLALRMAQAELDRSLNIQDLLPAWQGGALLPVIISLGRLGESLPAGLQKGQAGLIEEYITRSLIDDERLAGFAPHCLESLRRSGGLVLFDGLDEVADLHLRPVVVQAVEDFVELYSKNQACRFLVTCRTYSYHHDTHWQLTGWPTFELALLDKNKIDKFVNAWHAELTRIEPSRRADYSRKREKLLASLQPDDRRRLHEIAPFPIILTMMAVVHTHYGELPDTRAQVYEKCVDLLLVRWELDRPVTGQTLKPKNAPLLMNSMYRASPWT